MQIDVVVTQDCPQVNVNVQNAGPEIVVDLTNDTLEVNVELTREGPPGKTPQRGVDYWTDADKAEIVKATLAALPVYEGEAVVVG